MSLKMSTLPNVVLRFCNKMQGSVISRNPLSGVKLPCQCNQKTSHLCQSCLQLTQAHSTPSERVCIVCNSQYMLPLHQYYFCVTKIYTKKKKNHYCLCYRSLSPFKSLPPTCIFSCKVMLQQRCSRRLKSNLRSKYHLWNAFQIDRKKRNYLILCHCLFLSNFTKLLTGNGIQLLLALLFTKNFGCDTLWLASLLSVDFLINVFQKVTKH